MADLVVQMGVGLQVGRERRCERLFQIPEVADAFYLRSISKRDRAGKWSLPD